MGWADKGPATLPIVLLWINEGQEGHLMVLIKVIERPVCYLGILGWVVVGHTRHHTFL